MNRLAIAHQPKDWLTIERVINCTFKARNELGFVTADEVKNLSEDPKRSVGRVYQALVKWQSLPYSECKALLCEGLSECTDKLSLPFHRHVGSL